MWKENATLGPPYRWVETTRLGRLFSQFIGGFLLALCGLGSLAHALPVPTPEQLEQFKQLSEEEQHKLAEQFGLDLPSRSPNTPAAADTDSISSVPPRDPFADSASDAEMPEDGDEALLEEAPQKINAPLPESNQAAHAELPKKEE